MPGMEAAVWCLAHIAYEEDQKDAMLAMPRLMRALVGVLKSKEIASLKLKGGAAAVMARLTVRGSLLRGVRRDKKKMLNPAIEKRFWFQTLHLTKYKRVKVIFSRFRWFVFI